MGATVDPVAPFSFSGSRIKANSLTRFDASSSNFRLSRIWIPFTASRIWCTGDPIFGSGFGFTSTDQLSEPMSIGFCFASHSAAVTPMPGSVFIYRTLSLPHSFSPAGVDDDGVARLERQVLALQCIL